MTTVPPNPNPHPDPQQALPLSAELAAWVTRMQHDPALSPAVATFIQSALVEATTLALHEGQTVVTAEHLNQVMTLLYNLTSDQDQLMEWQMHPGPK